MQYWHEAGMYQDFWLEPCSHRLPYFGGERRWESRLVLFIIFWLNPVLPAEAPICLDVIMANTGWNLARAKYKEKNWDLIQKMNRQEREKVVPEEHEREVIRTHERTRGEADCKYLKTLTITTIRHHQEVKKRAILVAEKKGSQHHQTSQVRHFESRHRDKHRSSHHWTPPAKKTLTKTMPQGPASMPPVRLHCNHTTSKWETSSPEPAEGGQGVEVKTPSPPTEDRLEWTPMPELHSEDEEDPLNWDKYLTSLAHKEQARMESLQRLVPLLDTPESMLESQAGTIADTLEVELELAAAHKLTGEGTTGTMDPTTSDGFTEGDEGDGNIDYDELEAMYHGARMCWDNRREGIFPSTAPEHHPVPSPPIAKLDEPRVGTGMVLDAPTVSPLEAMLDEPRGDAGAVPDTSPAMELQLLQSLEQEQPTSIRETSSSEQAEHSPQWVESSPPPSDASPPGPTYSSSETPPLPDLGTGYSSTSLSEEVGEGNNATGEDAPTEVDEATIEADSTGMTVTEPDIGAPPWKLSKPGKCVIGALA